MKLKNIIVVTIILLGLLAYIYKVELPKQEQKKAEISPYHSSLKAQIAAISVAQSSNKFRLENSKAQSVDKDKLNQEQLRILNAVNSEDWKLLNLAFDKVDSNNLNGLINQISSLQLGEALPSSELDSDLSLYGLKSPELVLEIDSLEDSSARKTLKFEFGKKSDFLAKRYVRYTRADGSADIFLVDDLLYFAASKPLKDFRSKNPISFNDKEISKLEIITPNAINKISLQKNADKKVWESEFAWRLFSPISASADSGKVSETLRDLKNLKVKDYFEADPSKDNLFSLPNLEALLFKQGDENPLKIKIVNDPSAQRSKVYFTISSYPTVFEADAISPDLLSSDVSVFRKKKYFDIEVDGVTGVELSGSYSIGLKGEKQDDVWKIDGKLGDETFIRQWLLDIKDVSILSFPGSLIDFGFSQPTLKLSLKFQDIIRNSKQYERQFIIGSVESFEAGKPKTYYAAVDELSEPFIVSADVIDKLIPKPESLLAVPTSSPTLVPTPNS